MVDSRLASILRDIGLAETRTPARDLQQQEAVKRVVDPTGTLIREAIARHLPPMGMDWSSGATSRQRVKRAGVVAILAAYASTAPTTGDATITLTQYTAASGTETIATLTIPKTLNTAEVAPMVAVPAGAWLLATVTTANGASGVSTSVTITIGGA